MAGQTDGRTNILRDNSFYKHTYSKRSGYYTKGRDPLQKTLDAGLANELD